MENYFDSYNADPDVGQTVDIEQIMKMKMMQLMWLVILPMKKWMNQLMKLKM